ncbi:MAG TPA: YebC/PmpR family DNA-binding transcriptional regulator [Elusimicrobiota bacterium]|nr:YebC/PmpR family DNA-binding transcriptional regulator [Elusimicrobiota bacterium]
MSGHSRWAGIKHKKALIDAKRGKVFTKIIRELTVAAREGGGVIENNPRLRTAVDTAREANMPMDNVKKAIARGTGEIPGVMYEETTYEGYGPAGVAIFLSGTTDNKNRTSSEIRKIFTSSGGNLGESGCVGWMFEKKGFLSVDRKAWPDEEKLMSLAIEAGADDFQTDDDYYEITTAPADYEKVKKALGEAKVPLESAELTFLPKSSITLGKEEAEKTIALIDALEQHDDVQEVYSNADFPKEVLEKAGD